MATYESQARARCPHCLTVVSFETAIERGGSRRGSMALMAPGRPGEDTEMLDLVFAACPACRKLIVTIRTVGEDSMGMETEQEYVVWPLCGARPVPQEVPSHIAADYTEAALVLNLSPKASAALSRRCLQAVLREAGNAHQRNLSEQIDAVMSSLPSYIAEGIDAIRVIGNFAAHPMKAENSGQIVEVEPGEAEWILDVLEMLFDFYYVQPARARERRAALNAKLKAAGKPPMKGPSP